MSLNQIYTPKRANEKAASDQPLSSPDLQNQSCPRDLLDGYINQCIDSLDIVIDLLVHDGGTDVYKLLQKHYNLQWLQYDLSIASDQQYDEMYKRFVELTGITTATLDPVDYRDMLATKVKMTLRNLTDDSYTKRFEQLRIYLVRAIRDVQIEYQLKLKDKSEPKDVQISVAVRDLLREVRLARLTKIPQLTIKFLDLEQGSQFTSGRVLREYYRVLNQQADTPAKKSQ